MLDLVRAAPPRIFEHRKKKGYNCPFFDPYNFHITRLSARRSVQMENFKGIKIFLYLLFRLVLKYMLVGCPLDRKPTIRNKIHKRESKLLKQNNKEEKEILPFVTQYQPSVSTIKEA